MKHTLSKISFACHSKGVIAALAIVCAASLTITLKAQDDQAGDLFYSTSSSKANAEVFAIQVRGSRITTRDIGSTFGGGCISLALSPSGTLFSMCGDLTPSTGIQYLAIIDKQTGAAKQVGLTVTGLSVMAIAFGPNSTLYAVGNFNTNDLSFNTLYTVDEKTGAFTPVGPTGAPQFFMDLAFDRNGNLFGVTTDGNCSFIPAILYRIDPGTGRATKPVNLVGSNCVMGLAFGKDGNLYATDFAQNPGLYIIDIKTGFERAIAALPFGFSSALELVNSHEE